MHLDIYLCCQQFWVHLSNLEFCLYDNIIQYFLVCSGTSSSVSFDTIPQASLEDMMGGQGTVLPSYDETALCSGAFKVLRSMVSAWLRDVSLYKNVFADLQILHFYRFVTIFIMLLCRAQQILDIRFSPSLIFFQVM